jgi:hypothetical protein
VALAIGLAGALFALPLAVRGLVRALQAAVNGSVWVAASISAGMDAWTIGATIGRAIAGTLVTTEAFVVVLGLVGVGAAALFGLQRLLGAERESSR